MFFQEIAQTQSPTQVTHIWRNHRGQPKGCAMEGPHPRGTALVITVDLRAETTNHRQVVLDKVACAFKKFTLCLIGLISIS